MTISFRQTVTEYLAGMADVPPEEVTDDATLGNLCLDSLEAMDALYNLEGMMGVRLSNKEAVTERTTVHELIDMFEAACANST